MSITRLEGKDRYLTAIALAKNVGSYNELIICNSKDNGANASAIASTAAQNNIPILYNDSKSKLNANTYNFIQQNASNIKEIYVIGNGFDKTQNNWIKNKGIIITEITGKNAYEINAKIQEKFTVKYSSLFLVNNTVDAISANYAATKNTSLVLYSNKNLTTDQINLVKKNNISKIYYTGGDKIKTPLKEVEKALGIVKEGITTSDGSDGYPAGTRLISNGVYTFPEFHQLPKVGKNYTLYQNVAFGGGTLKTKGCNVFASATVVSGLLGDASVEPISYLNNLKKFGNAKATSDEVFKNDFLKKYYGLQTESCTTEKKMLEWQLCSNRL